jgi:hypothetical protein
MTCAAISSRSSIEHPRSPRRRPATSSDFKRNAGRDNAPDTRRPPPTWEQYHARFVRRNCFSYRETQRAKSARTKPFKMAFAASRRTTKLTCRVRIRWLRTPRNLPCGPIRCSIWFGATAARIRCPADAPGPTSQVAGRAGQPG